MLNISIVQIIVILAIVVCLYSTRADGLAEKAIPNLRNP